MSVVVISPEKPDPREPLVLAQLLDAGLPRYHVRKPAWSALELEQWILFLPDWCRSRLVLHQHHHLVEKLGLGGVHAPAGTVAGGACPEPAERADPGPSGFRSRSCHNLDELTASLGRYDSLFFSPVFPSISKPGYAPPADRDEAALTALLQSPRTTEVLALGGITAANAASCLARGFNGVAVLGAIWQAADPVREYLRICRAGVLHPPVPSTDAAGARPQPDRESTSRPALPPVMCLTQDGLALSHAEQARQLCAAGARWIQLRMKSAPASQWLATAREVVAICRRAGALCVVNDSVEIALDSGADGVHLGKEDGAWSEARGRLGPRRLVGGTVNNVEDARRARAAACLDYVGIGPFRFTSTKARLAPVLGADGIRQVLGELGDLPAWVIGGVAPEDVPAIRQLGAAGIAVSSSLYRAGNLAANFRAFAPPEPARTL